MHSLKPRKKTAGNIAARHPKRRDIISPFIPEHTPIVSIKQGLYKEGMAWVVLWYLGVTASIAYFGWLPLNPAKVDLKLTVNKVSFTLSKPWHIKGLRVNSLGISLAHPHSLTVSDVLWVEEAAFGEMDHDTLATWNKQPVISGRLNIKGLGGLTNLTSRYLSIASLKIDAGTLLTVSSHTSEKRQLRIQFQNTNISGQIDTGTLICLQCSNCDCYNCDLQHHPSADGDTHSKNLRITTNDDGGQVMLQHLHAPFGLVLNIPEDNQAALGNHIAIDSIAFIREDDGDPVSSIVKDGFVQFVQLNQNQITIPADDFLFMKGLNNFKIKRLSLQKNLHISLYGDVSELKSGADILHTYSRRPSVLEKLYANQSLILFLTATLVIFPVFWSLFTFVGKLKEQAR